jgi:hypothetical protein
VRKHEARERRDTDARAFRALAVLRACGFAMAGLFATFFVYGLLWGLGALPILLIFPIAALAAALLAPRVPWVAVGVVALLTLTQVLSLLAAPTIGTQMMDAVVSRELGWEMPRASPWTLLPRTAIAVSGLLALGFVVGAGGKLSATRWDELLAAHPRRKRLHRLVAGAGVLVGAASMLGVCVGYLVERAMEDATVVEREDALTGLKSAFEDAWNTGDLDGVAACFLEDEQISAGDRLESHLSERGYDAWPEIEFVRESGDDSERFVYYRVAGSRAEPFLRTEWRLWGPRWVLRDVRVRKR